MRCLKHLLLAMFSLPFLCVHGSETYEVTPHSTKTIDSQESALYEFDAFDQLTHVVFPNGKTVAYAYDFRNNLAKITYPDQSEVTFQYDLDNRLETIQQGDRKTRFEYDHHKNLLIRKVFPNGVIASYHYDSDKHIDQVAYSRASGARIACFNYVFDANGNRKIIERTVGGVTKKTEYTYDHLDRLLEANHSDGSFERFTYDGWGNRLTKSTPEKTVTYRYNEKQQLIYFDDVTLSYDASGNLKRKETPKEASLYFYNDQNLLSRVEREGCTTQFEYDTLGNRIAKVVNGVRTTYINDLRSPISNVLLEETEGKCTNYCYAGGIHSSEDSEKTHYYLFDSPNRSVALIVDEKGEIENQHEYTAFGELKGNDTNSNNHYLYSGQQWDEEAGLIYLRHRYYDPEVGRFISVDPDPGSLFNPQTLNPYTYVLNNPVNLIDLTGTRAELPPEGMVCYEVCAYDRTPLHLHRTRTGHGWQEFTSSDGSKKSIGHYPLKDTDGLVYFRKDDHLNSLFPTSRIRSLKFVIPESQADLIYEATEAFCSQPYHLLKHNCIDAVKAGMDAGGFSHPDFKTVGLSDPLLLHQFIRYENFKTNMHSKVASFSNWIQSFSQGAQSQAIDNTTSLYYNPMTQPDFGGVSLSKRAEMSCNLTDIHGVVYDHEKGQLIFFGSQNPSLPKMNFDDLAVAIRSLYGLGKNPPQHPGVSIDHSDNPELQSVRYDGATEGTHFGWVMFEADRILKCLVAGIDNHTGKPMKVKVPGYESLVKRYEKSKKMQKNHSARFWFIPKRIILNQSTDGHAILFSEVKMDVCHESKFTKGIITNPQLEAFAKHLRDHFDAYAQEFPIFQELLELGKIAATVKWIHDNQIPVDLEYFRNYTPLRFNTPEHTKTLATAYAHSGKVFFISGGVVYACHGENTFYQPSSRCTELEKVVVSKRENEKLFSWEFESSIAQAIPWTKTRKPGNYKRSHLDLSSSVPGNHELNFVRYYDSYCDIFSPIGFGWRLLPFSLKPGGCQSTVSFKDGTTRSAYTSIIFQDRDQQKLFKLCGATQDKNLVYSCDRGYDTLYLNEDFSSTLYRKKGGTIIFNSEGLPEKEHDSYGIELTYQYQNDQLVSITHSSGGFIEFEYINGRLTRAWNTEDMLLEYQYNSKGQLESVSNSLGCIESYEYDNDLRINKITDSKGNVIFEGSYDDYNRLATHRKSGCEINHTYNLSERSAQLSFGTQILNHIAFNHQNLKSVHSAQPKGEKEGWKYKYDDLGNLSMACDPLGNQSNFSYDSFGNLKVQELPNGNVIRYLYNEKNTLKQIYYKCCLEEQAHCKYNGLFFSSFNDMNYSASFDYDEWGNLSSIQHATGPREQFHYNSHGLVDRITTQLGYIIEKEYDEYSRLKWIKNSGKGLKEFVYDETGRLIKISTNGKEKTCSYFPDGNIQSVKDPLGNETFYFYNSQGLVNKVIDAEGVSTVIDYSDEEIHFYQS